jgi:hypothetical protein
MEVEKYTRRARSIKQLKELKESTLPARATPPFLLHLKQGLAFPSPDIVSRAKRVVLPLLNETFGIRFTETDGLLKERRQER